MNKNIIIAIIVVAVLVLGAALLLKTAPSSQNQTSTTTQTETTTAPAEATKEPSATGSAKSDVREITVTGSSFKFDPSKITIKKGEKVKITFKNAGGMHNFIIDELGVETPIVESGKDATVEFTADKTGSFKYYCSVSNHRAMGMEGTLTVE